MSAKLRPTIFVLGWLAIGPALGADEFPYEAYVTAEQADVVAGPGHRFYVTERLPWGAQVAIYREEASGWLAIRPPAGSFSWVPGEFIERLEDDLGRVTEPTGAWIGTTIEHVSQHQQQITLKSGELVQILGEKAVEAAAGGERIWLKIAPPAGEYRWIYLRDVSRQKPATQPATRLAAAEEAESQAPEAEDGEVPQRFELSGNPIALSSLEEPRVRPGGAVALAQFRSNAATSSPAPSSPDGFVPRRKRDGAAVPSGASSVATRATVPMPVSSPQIAPLPTAAAPRATGSTGLIATPAAAAAAMADGLSSAEVNRQLDQIEIDLSLLLAQDRSQWNLAPLKQRVQALVEGGGDPASRGRARLMLDKIKQFETTFRTAAEPVGPGASVRAASSSLTDPRYDAQGVLKEVVSRKGAKPAAPYAVVDAEGKPLCFISPSPGLNLNRYINKPVGLYGRRGYLEELKKPHVVAENVIELDTRLR